jgi:hypothetical protein
MVRGSTFVPTRAPSYFDANRHQSFAINEHAEDGLYLPKTRWAIAAGSAYNSPMPLFPKVCWSLIAAVVLFPISSLAADPAAKPDYSTSLQAIARDVENLKSEFPQLQEFSTQKNSASERLVIEYAYHTHQATHRGGWTSGVPNPDDDGVWFYIDFHDPESRAQIHTQPMIAALWLADKRVSFLILEGKHAKPLAGRIGAILKSHGVTDCR